MKKFRLLAALAVVLMAFGACTKDELKESDQGSKDQILKRADVYLENDYLAFKNIESVDSMKKVLDSKSEDSRLEWERSMNFTSASNYRNQLSKKLETFDSEESAKSFIEKITNEGYFSSNDSSLTYPFRMIAWNAVLNPKGLVKINGVLYCFKVNEQLAILDGSIARLNNCLTNKNGIEDTLVKVIKFAAPKLNGYNFGEALVSSELIQTLNYTYKFRVHLRYCAMRYYSTTGINEKDRVYYEFYYQHQRKKLCYWIDHETTFYYYPDYLKIGGAISQYPLWQDSFVGTESKIWHTANSSISADYNQLLWAGDIPPTLGNCATGPVVQLNYRFHSEKVGSEASPLSMDIYY